MPSHRLPSDFAESLFSGAANVIDPGNGGTIGFNLKNPAVCKITPAVGAAETRVLESPTLNNYPIGQELLVYVTLIGGASLVVTGSQDGPANFTASEYYVFKVVGDGTTSGKYWRTVAGSGSGAAARGVSTLAITSNTSGSATLTYSAMTGIYELSTGSTATLTFPTGAALLSQYPAMKTGDSWTFLINNNNSGNTTLAAGASGSTLEGGSATIATTVCRLIRIIVTDASTGAYTAYVVV